MRLLAKGEFDWKRLQKVEMDRIERRLTNFWMYVPFGSLILYVGAISLLPIVAAMGRILVRQEFEMSHVCALVAANVLLSGNGLFRATVGAWCFCSSVGWSDLYQPSIPPML